MSRKKRKRGNGTVLIDGLSVPKKMGPVAKQYYDKFGIRIDKPKTGVGSGTGYTPGTGYGSSTYTSTYKKKTCKHFQDPIQLAEDIIIHASASRDIIKGASYPNVGVYFASTWDDFSNKTMDRYSPTWQGPKKRQPNAKDVGNSELALVDWPDMGVPKDTDYAVKVLEYALNKAGDGKMVEIGCIGAHGRTGSALAAMKIMLGEVDASAAIKWVRDNHCEDAIESKSQVDWIHDLALRFHPVEAAKIEAEYKKKIEAEKPKGSKTSTDKPVFNSFKGGWNKKEQDTLLDDIDKALGKEDGEDEDAFWLRKAVEEFDNLSKSGGTVDDHIEFLCEMYQITEWDLSVALFGKSWAIAGGIEDPDENKVNEQEDDSKDYASWLEKEALRKGSDKVICHHHGTPLAGCGCAIF